MRESVIVSAVRLPTGRFLGGLKDFTAPQLGAMVVREAVRRAGIDPASVDECIMGNVLSAGLGQNPARQAALGGGLDERVAAMTINKVCGSGLKAVMLAAQGICDRRHRHRRRRRTGVDERRSIPAPARSRRPSHGGCRDRRLDGARRPVVRVRELSHGHERRGGRREVLDRPARAGLLRRLEPPESGAGHPGGLVQGRNPSCLHPAEEGGANRPRPGRIGAARLYARGARRPEACVQEGRHGDRGQCTRRQRRRRGGRDHGGGAREGARPHAHGARRRPGDERPRAEAGDDDAGRGRAEGRGEGRLETAGRRPLRAERSVLGAGGGRHARAWHRSRPCQRPWRRGRARPSHRRLRGAHPDDAAVRDATARREARDCDAVPRAAATASRSLSRR